jgi:hypothetical protein
MAVRLIRVWKLLDSEDIGKQLLVIGELSAECAKCKTIGIDHKQAKQCPKCGTTFRYMTARRSSGAVIKRLAVLRPDLIPIELEDFRSGEAVDRSLGLFG